jgi:predicted RNase H-like nuclease
VFEVFPAPALVRLFGLERALTYKKKRHRTSDTCRAGLSSYIRHLQRLTSPPLTFNTPPVVNSESGKGLKHIEDQVDAVTCAYLAALAWLYGDERLEMVGTLEEGYVVVPRPSDFT